MNLCSLLLLCSFSIAYCTTDNEADLKRVLDSYLWRDPNCTFNYAQVNSTTVKLFPQCTTVYGVIVINEKTDLVMPQLQTAFRNVRKIYGGIRIENTNYTSLTIFPMNRYTTLYCENYGFYIRNNSKLIDANLIMGVNSLPNENKEACDFRIEDNQQLDVEDYCNSEHLEKLLRLRTSGNLKNCGCQGDQITPENLASYSKCTRLFNGLKLSNITDTTSLLALSSVKEIRGDIEIYNSSVQSLEFLENMKVWKVRGSERVIINLQNNPNMTRLPFGFFGSIENILYGVKIANFENLHPDFCLSVEEILQVFELQFSFKNLHAKVCDDIGNIGDKVLCRFKSMSDLPNNCDIILGNIIVENGDDDHMTKLPDVSLVIGNVIFRYTELEDLQYFYVPFIMYTSDSSPIIQIFGNRKLKNPAMDSLSNVITRDEKRTAAFQDNYPDIFPSGICRLVSQGALSSYPDKKYQTRLNFIGGDCGDHIEVKASPKFELMTVLMSTIIYNVYWVLRQARYI